MAAARGNRERLIQIGKWLAAEHPTPYPVTLRIVKKIAALPGAKPIERGMGDAGETYREGRRIVIRIACRPSLARAYMIDALLHEHAHATSMRHDSIEGERGKHGGHDAAWALDYGSIYRHFVDNGGSEASGNY